LIADRKIVCDYYNNDFTDRMGQIHKKSGTILSYTTEFMEYLSHGYTKIAVGNHDVVYTIVRHLGDLLPRHSIIFSTSLNNYSLDLIYSKSLSYMFMYWPSLEIRLFCLYQILTITSKYGYNIRKKIRSEAIHTIGVDTELAFIDLIPAMSQFHKAKINKYHVFNTHAQIKKLYCRNEEEGPTFPVMELVNLAHYIKTNLDLDPVNIKLNDYFDITLVTTYINYVHKYIHEPITRGYSKLDVVPETYGILVPEMHQPNKLGKQYVRFDNLLDKHEEKQISHMDRKMVKNLFLSKTIPTNKIYITHNPSYKPQNVRFICNMTNTTRPFHHIDETLPIREFTESSFEDTVKTIIEDENNKKK